MLNDVRFALRMISTHRWFSAAVILTMALGIGLNAMIFTLVDAVLMKPVGIPNGDRLVTMQERHPSNHDPNTNRDGVSYPDFRDMRAQNSTFERLEAGSYERDSTISEETNPAQSFRMTPVSAGMFEMMHVPPVVGRSF